MRDHHMICKAFTRAVAIGALIASSAAGAWSSDGDKINLTLQEHTYCRTWESDGIAVMWGRQFSTKPPFEEEGRYEVSEPRKKVRAAFLHDVKDYRIESTEDARMAVIEQYGKQMKIRCFGFITSQPSSKAP